MADPKNYNGKIIIDATNPMDLPKGMPPKIALGHSDSAWETIQRLLPEAKFVKAFNTIGNSHFIHPDFSKGGPPTMFINGFDNPSKKFVTDNILGKFGWETIDILGIDGSRLLEPLGFLWIKYYFRNGFGEYVFKLLRK